MNKEKYINIASRCQDIQVSLNGFRVPDYEAIHEIGMMIRLSLHIRGLPLIDYSILKHAVEHYMNIDSLVLKNIIEYLAEIEFVRIDKEGNSIKSVLPTVPYFDDIYEKVGNYAINERTFNEAEDLAMVVLNKLSESPNYKSSLYELGAEKSRVDRLLKIGQRGGFLSERKVRGKDIVISPAYFTENTDIYSDVVAKHGAKSIERINKILRANQGWPLSLIETTGKIRGEELSLQDINLLKRLAQDGAIKPPALQTNHSGLNYFMFTPTPGKAKLLPSKKEIYERAIALISSVRQGQLLPKKYEIKNPLALLESFKRQKSLGANTEAPYQYSNLVTMRMCFLEDEGNGYKRLRLIDSEENIEALEMAISLLSAETNYQGQIDDNFRFALQQDQKYIESMLASAELRKKEQINLSEEIQEEIDDLFFGLGVC